MNLVFHLLVEAFGQRLDFLPSTVLITSYDAPRANIIIDVSNLDAFSLKSIKATRQRRMLFLFNVAVAMMGLLEDENDITGDYSCNRGI